MAEDAAARPQDLVNRQFTAARPNALRVCDLTYIRTWVGFAYLALVVDVYSRRIVGWALATHLRTELPLHELYFDSVAQVRLNRWSKGREALLGDAAYSPSLLSGMGSGLAVVGAYVLAGELAATGGDHRVAYAHYEQIMRPYVHRAQRSGATISRFMVPKGQLLTALLNRYVRLIPYLPGKQLVANTARRTAEAVELRDYP